MVSKKNNLQKGYVITRLVREQLKELKLLGFTISNIVRDAIDEQLEIENIVDTALQSHKFSTFYLEGL